ncbi:MAG: tRNA 2-thiocytidine biosynthesis protein TtcA [Candidatus Cloacimonetes bacterium]|nr:tRNA 2-thiocytidine biosynthesis protein TtcA [Candidatus Cloacimonadota bacterium]
MNDILFDKNFGKWFINDVLRAIRKYELINENEKIAVALSGGKDSTTLLYILAYLKKFSNLSFSLSAAHIKIADYNTSKLRDFCRDLNVSYYEEKLNSDIENTIENCYICSRLKRGALSSLLSKYEIFKVAYGHHATDIAETFLMNIVENKKLAALTPKVEISESPMMIIRPMIYLEEDKISQIHSHLNLPYFDMPCPYKAKTKRDKYKGIIQNMNRAQPNLNFSKKIIETLEKSDLKDWSE